MILCIIFFVLFFAVPAHAFGPATHVDLSLSILSSAPLIIPAVRKLITKYQEAFIYGSSSPDIIIGKRYMDYMYNGHNWKVAFNLLNKANTPEEKSAVYGFLSHLASDTVAHNYFIPFKIVRSFELKLPTHTYWEMMFDLEASISAWHKLETLQSIDNFDKLLEKELRRFAFSFRTNKAIFSTILNIQKTKALRKRFAYLNSKTEVKLEKENREHYFNLALDASRSILNKNENSHVIFADPMGTSRIKEAKELRNELRKRKTLGKLNNVESEKFLELLKGLMALAIYKPKLHLPKFE